MDLSISIPLWLIITVSYIAIFWLVVWIDTQWVGKRWLIKRNSNLIIQNIIINFDCKSEMLYKLFLITMFLAQPVLLWVDIAIYHVIKLYTNSKK